MTSPKTVRRLSFLVSIRLMKKTKVEFSVTTMNLPARRARSTAIIEAFTGQRNRKTSRAREISAISLL